MFVTFGLSILGMVAVTYVSVIIKVLSYCDLKNDNDPDGTKAVMDYMSDIGMKNFSKIQFIMTAIPYISSGAIVLILLGMIYGL